MTFKGLLTSLLAVCAFGAAATQSAAQTVVNVTQINYDEYNRPICTAVRMNPAAYGALPSDACALGLEGSFGPDRITKNQYDVAGQLTQVDQAYGTPVQRAYARYTYTVGGQKETEKDANGNLTTFEYDAFNRLKKLRYPNVALGAGSSSTTDYEEYDYDANSNRNYWRRRNGTVIRYCHDPLNRTVRESVSGALCGSPGQSVDVFTGYDLIGNILYKRFSGTAGGNPGVTYTYDGLGRVSDSMDMYGRAVHYDYNQASARSKLTYPDGNWQPYTRDALNRLTSSGMGAYSFTLGYDNLGRMTSVSRNNSTTTSYGYDNLGRLTAMGHEMAGADDDINWLFKERNPAGQITIWDASTTRYDYDEQTSSTDNPVYDGLNRDATLASLTGGYDANGNLAKEGSSSDKRCMTYDNMNRLVSVAWCNTPSIPFLTLTYDPEGRLAAYSYNLVTTQFAYDGVNLIGEYQNGTMTQRYLHGGGTDNPVIWYTGASVTSGAHFFVTNYQGSVIGTTNTSGTRMELYKYDPYGVPKNFYNNTYWGGSRFRYTGQYAIPEAKLYYYKARVYDPTYGRFLQTDPIGSDDDLNMYSYTKGDPINATDPTGEVVDTIVDVGFLIFDVGALAYDEVTTGGANRTENLIALGADTAATFVPFVTGAGVATRVAIHADDAVKVVKSVAKTCCFVAGTQVSTKDGLRAIEKIKVGDLVLSKDEVTGQMAFKPVTDLIQRHDRLIYEVTVKVVLPTGESRTTVFRTTDDHPWRTKDGHWLTTLELKPDVIVQSAYGSGVEVVSVVNTGKATKTYNLEVADFHTYFVGDDRVWVHNSCTYQVPGSRTQSGKPYVGQTGKPDPSQRPGNGRDGRSRQAGDAKTQMPGATPQQRRVQEQKDLNTAGGVEKTDNKRNAVAPKFWEKWGIKPPGS